MREGEKPGLPVWAVLVALLCGVAATIAFQYLYNINSIANYTRSIDRHLAVIERYMEDMRYEQ